MKLVEGGDEDDSCGGISFAEPEPATRRWQAQPQLRFPPFCIFAQSHVAGATTPLNPLLAR
jgi:hypothetical protein